MQDDTHNKNSVDKNNRITQGNNPNDDEEILNNNADNKESRPANDKLQDNKADKTDGSETIGIP